MAQDLLAPPKFKPKSLALALALVCAFPVGLCVLEVRRGSWSWTELAWRLGSLFVLCIAVMMGNASLVRYAKRVTPQRMPYIHAAIAVLMGVVIVFTLTVSLRGTMLGNAGPGYLFMLPMMVGMVLAQGGWGRRVGESLHCPTCEYEFTFAERDAPIRCPECGTPWLGMLRKGRRVKSIKMMVSGISIALLGAFLFQPIFWLGPLARILPTPILYTALYMDPGSSLDAWDELTTRSISATSTRSLARRVAAHRLQHQWGSAADKWFEANVAAGKIPAEIKEHLYGQSFATRLDAPKEVQAGTPFPVRLQTSRAATGLSSQLAVMFAGYSLDGAEPVGRADEPAWAHELRPSLFGDARINFQHEFRIDTPGRHTIRATYWVIFQPSFWTITWGPDGTPIRPAAATWFERSDLEREIIVK